MATGKVEGHEGRAQERGQRTGGLGRRKETWGQRVGYRKGDRGQEDRAK